MISDHRKPLWLGHVIGSALAMTLLAAGVMAQTSTDFEPSGFTPGQSVNNRQPDGTIIIPAMTFGNSCREAWFVPTAGTDEEIVDLGLDPHGKVWRMSTAVDAGSLGQNPHSPRNPSNISGETASLPNDACGLSSSTNFYAELDFRSATGGAQSGLRFAIDANSSDTRQAFVRIEDSGAGFDLTYFSTGNGCSFPSAAIVTGLSYGWHTLGIEIFFVDGLASGTVGAVGAEGNDIVNIYVDHTLVNTSTTWESCVGPRVVDQLLFETGAEDPVFAGGGLYFDNVLVTDLCPPGNCNLPPTFSSVGDCISTLMAENCTGLTGRDRAQCNHEQQAYCFDLFK